MKMNLASECMASYFEVLGTRDSKSVAELFHENGFVVWGNRIWRGREEIQEFYEELLGNILVPEMEYESKYEIVEANIAYMVWSGKCPSHEVNIGVGNFVIEENQIHCLTLYMEGNY